MYVHKYTFVTHKKTHHCPIPTNCWGRRCWPGRMSRGNAAAAQSSAPGSVASKRTMGAVAEGGNHKQSRGFTNENRV